MGSRLRHLVLVLGDQLDRRSSALDDFDPQTDVVWMAETEREATHVPAHKLRLAAFFSAMRHFRDECRERGWTVEYHALGADRARDRGRDFAEILRADFRRRRPHRLVMSEPGDWRVRTMLEEAAAAEDLVLDIRPEGRFLCSIEDFRGWARGRKSLVLEHFYRWMRKREGLLVDVDGKPEGGRWNYDEENRESFGPAGPPPFKTPHRFVPDDLSLEVLGLVRRRFAKHPGRLDAFDLPVTRAQALTLLRDFIEHRLPSFGRHQDAIWEGEPVLSHSRLSFPLNVGLLHPRECLDRAIAAYEAGHAPLNGVEGFVRQILGWREYVRGIYWLHMPDYLDHNALRCDPDADVPVFYWDGQTQMRCVGDAMNAVLEHGYAHHIVRLMVLGLFALLLGVHPRRFHEWHMAMYVDAVDWVSLPNALGMSQFGDGGIVGSKPYCATGKYIQRMGNHCTGCRYDPSLAYGEAACPFTTLYWDFLDRHRERFAANRRMTFQVRNLERKSGAEISRIRQRATKLIEDLRNGGRL